MTDFLISVVPSIGVLFIFWIVLRALLQADRRERNAQARIEARARAEAQARNAVGSAGPGQPERPAGPPADGAAG